MIGKIGLTVNGTIYVSFGNFYFEMYAPNSLKEIYSINDWDEDGYFALETNYGEEYYEIKEFMKYTYTQYEIENNEDLKLLSIVKDFEIIRGSVIMDVEELIVKADIIVNNIALLKNNGNLTVIDLSNTDNKMHFRNVGGSFVLNNSSFSDEARKYQALYIVKCNEKLLEEL